MKIIYGAISGKPYKAEVEDHVIESCEEARKLLAKMPKGAEFDIPIKTRSFPGKFNYDAVLTVTPNSSKLNINEESLLEDDDLLSLPDLVVSKDFEAILPEIKLPQEDAKILKR